MRSFRFITPYLVTVILLVLLAPNLSHAENYAWTSLGPEGGSINALVIDRANIYAGTNGGLFKSTDGGSNWTPISITGLAYPSIYSLAVDPNYPNIIYAGATAAVYKSTNGGNTWSATGPFPSSVLIFLPVSSLAVDPNYPNIIYAGVSSCGVVKSTDYGSHWTAFNDGLTSSTLTVNAFAFSTNPGTIYMGTSGGTYKLTINESTWAKVGGIIGTASTTALAIDPTNPDIICAWKSSQEWVFPSIIPPGMYKSTNGGSSWTRSNTQPSNNTSMNVLAIDPTDSQIIYAGTNSGVFKGINFGDNWSIFASIGNTRALAVAVALGSEGTTFYGGTSTGVVKGINNTWNDANKGLLGYTVNSLVVSPTPPESIFAGTDGGLFISTDSGSRWDSTTLTGSITSLAIDPINPNIIFAGSGGIRRSIDGGSNWSSLTSGLPTGFFSPSALAIAPTNSQIIYTGGMGSNFIINPCCQSIDKSGVYMSANGGNTWSATTLTGFIISLAIDPTDPNIIYAGSFSGMFRSINGGSTWLPVTAGMPATVGTATAIVIAPTPPYTIYASIHFLNTTSVEVYKSIDGGTSWTYAGLTASWIRSLAVDPTSAETIYAGTDGEVFKSTDGGSNWSATGLNTTTVPSLAISSSLPSLIYAGTNHGAFKILFAGQAVLYLSDVIASLNLGNGISTELDSKLHNVEAALNAANSGNRGDALNKLQAFINSVQAQRGKKLTYEQADYLIKAAQMIMGSI
jgi:photosystem II stability/assembly factor-like uncharacterized protein